MSLSPLHRARREAAERHGEPIPLFDRPRPAPEPTPFETGMTESARASGRWSPEEVEQVDDAIRAAAAASPDGFTTDDVWRRIPDVPVTKGMASRLLVAARAGLIRNSGETTIARRGGAHDHAQRLTIWRGA